MLSYVGQESFIQVVMHEMSWISTDLQDVQKRWKQERNTISAASYRQVISFFLRKTKIPAERFVIICSGNTIKVEIKADKSFEIKKVVYEYSDKGCRAYTITSTVLEGKELEAKRASDWAKYYKKHGLKKSDLGKTIFLDGEEFTIIGCKARVQRFGIWIKRSNGITASCRAEAVIEALKQKGSK